MSDRRLGAAALILTALSLGACSPADGDDKAQPAVQSQAAADSKFDNPKPLPGDVSLPLPWAST